MGDIMDSVSLYDPQSFSNPVLTERQMLQLTRPTYRTRFVRHGDEVHLLVYLNDDKALPFVRIPCEVLLNSALAYEQHQLLQA